VKVAAALREDLGGPVRVAIVLAATVRVVSAEAIAAETVVANAVEIAEIVAVTIAGVSMVRRRSNSRS